MENDISDPNEPEADKQDLPKPTQPETIICNFHATLPAFTGYGVSYDKNQIMQNLEFMGGVIDDTRVKYLSPQIISDFTEIHKKIKSIANKLNAKHLRNRTPSKLTIIVVKILQNSNIRCHESYIRKKLEERKGKGVIVKVEDDKVQWKDKQTGKDKISSLKRIINIARQMLPEEHINCTKNKKLRIAVNGN